DPMGAAGLPPPAEGQGAAVPGAQAEQPAQQAGPEPAGAALRYGNPWQGSADQRDAVRQLRGRMPAPVTVWLAFLGPGGLGPGGVTGLTISSALLAQGQPPLVAGLLPPLSDLAEVLSSPGSPFTVLLLGDGHQRYARHFSGEPAFPPDELTFETSTF